MLCNLARKTSILLRTNTFDCRTARKGRRLPAVTLLVVRVQCNHAVSSTDSSLRTLVLRSLVLSSYGPLRLGECKHKRQYQLSPLQVTGDVRASNMITRQTFSNILFFRLLLLSVRTPQGKSTTRCQCGVVVSRTLRGAWQWRRVRRRQAASSPARGQRHPKSRSSTGGGQRRVTHHLQ